MQDFDFHNPTRVIFGREKTALIGEVTAPYGKKALLLYGRESAKKTGLFGKVTKSLEKAGIEWIELGGVKPNPVLSFAKEAIELFRAEKLEAIVAIGGGSVIDTAKTVAAGVYYDGDVWDLFIDKGEVEKAVPITIVLTLAAAASEMNCGAVITNEETLQKFHVVGKPLFPKVSILDPVNTFTVPIDYSMYGAVDASIHLMEGYFNNSDDNTPLQDRLVEGLIKTIIESAEDVFKKPDDYDARANLMWSATLAFNGLTTSGMGKTEFPMHMIEHSLSAIYDIAHGAGLSIVGPAWMKYAARETPSKFAQFAERIFGICKGSEKEKAQKGIHALEKWFSSIKVPVRLREADIPASDIRKIAENAHMTAEQWGLDKYTVREIEEILKIGQ